MCRCSSALGMPPMNVTRSFVMIGATTILTNLVDGGVRRHAMAKCARGYPPIQRRMKQRRTGRRGERRVNGVRFDKPLARLGRAAGTTTKELGPIGCGWTDAVPVPGKIGEQNGPPLVADSVGCLA